MVKPCLLLVCLLAAWISYKILIDTLDCARENQRMSRGTAVLCVSTFALVIVFLLVAAVIAFLIVI